jgi:hypothetical protein
VSAANASGLLLTVLSKARGIVESDFQRLIGFEPTPERKPFSADVVANVLDKLHLPGLEGALQQVIETDERNKVFREGSYGGLRCVA